ncbi:hypothetical protein POM88_028405 [Heracleum sosnowskyi]|uniref:Reverse transcriptase/retrotransposon-derived protein RNase H-like domain-containing protein n=1 Tax=Heracleum sosnowskyi TaxID=360622 RepID=A0AAD8MGP1_9APIA|nr:hypothetical protein POM88_028405 [Heracleum sosnowskyi]
MEPPRTIKEVQKLTGRVAALGRFISNSGEKCLPFFKALKNMKFFEWTTESQEAFEALKKYMAGPPLLAKPKPGEVLYLYLAVSNTALRAVLWSLEILVFCLHAYSDPTQEPNWELECFLISSDHFNGSQCKCTLLHLLLICQKAVTITLSTIQKSNNDPLMAGECISLIALFFIPLMVYPCFVDRCNCYNTHSVDELPVNETLQSMPFR